jgi:hypothetical protein
VNLEKRSTRVRKALQYRHGRAATGVAGEPAQGGSHDASIESLIPFLSWQRRGTHRHWRGWSLESSARHPSNLAQRVGTTRYRLLC